MFPHRALTRTKFNGAQLKYESPKSSKSELLWQKLDYKHYCGCNKLGSANYSSQKITNRNIIFSGSSPITLQIISYFSTAVGVQHLTINPCSMKNALRILSLITFIALFSTNTQAAVFAVQESAESELQQQFGTDDLQEFMAMSTKEMGKRRGERLTFKERLAVKMVKRQVKKMQRRGEEVSLEAVSQKAATNINIGGFILGFLLGLIGVLIALLIDKDLVNSALIGFGIWLVIVLIAVVL